MNSCRHVWNEEDENENEVLILNLQALIKSGVSVARATNAMEHALVSYDVPPRSHHAASARRSGIQG